MLNYNYWTDREKKVIILKHKRGWAIVDIAAELGWSPRTISRILKEIDEKLEFVLKDD